MNTQERYVNESDGGSRADNSSYNSYSQPTNINLPHGDNERYHRYESTLSRIELYRIGFNFDQLLSQQPICWVFPVKARHQLCLYSGIQLLQWQLLAGKNFLCLQSNCGQSLNGMSLLDPRM